MRRFILIVTPLGKIYIYIYIYINRNIWTPKSGWAQHHKQMATAIMLVIFWTAFFLIARIHWGWTFCSLLVARYFLLINWLLVTFCSLLVTFCSMVVTFCPVFTGNCLTISHTCYPYLSGRWVLYIFVPGVTQGNEDVEWVQEFILLFLYFV